MFLDLAGPRGGLKLLRDLLVSWAARERQQHLEVVGEWRKVLGTTEAAVAAMAMGQSMLQATTCSWRGPSSRPTRTTRLSGEAAEAALMMMMMGKRAEKLTR